jgi:hypothetical protein
MSPFDRAIELGRARREHEERRASLLASQLKFGCKLTAAIDSQRVI